MDLFFFPVAAGRMEPYLLSIESRTGHLQVHRMAAKTSELLQNAIGRVLAFYTGHGHSVKTIKTDREANFISCEEFLHERGVHMLRTGTGCHAKQAERAIQTVKSRCRAVKCSLGYTLSKSLYQYMIMDVVGALNSSVNANCSPSTPNIIIMGFRASIPMHYQVPFGTIGIGKTPLNREKDDQPRGAISMLVGRDLSSQRSLKVLVLSTQRVIHVSSFTPIPLDRTVIHSLDEMATGNDEEENDEDPLAEESETLQNDPLEPSVMDLADFEDAILDEGLVPLQPLLPVRSHTNIVRLDGSTSAVPLPDEGTAANQEGRPQSDDMPPPATPPVPAPNRRPRAATRAPISPGVSERRMRTFRASTQATRAARQPQNSLELTAFAANHFGLLQRDEEHIFNLTIAEAARDYGLKPVEDAIRSEISPLITDTGALKPCKTNGQQLPLHLILGHKFE